MPRLLVLNGNQRGVFIPLDFESLKLKPLVLGRSTTNADVVLQSPQNLVSSRHAIISYRAEDGLLIISDPGSTNGTFVNGDRVAGNIPLFPGDWISCADVELVFLLPGPVGAPPPNLPVIRLKIIAPVWHAWKWSPVIYQTYHPALSAVLRQPALS